MRHTIKSSGGSSSSAAAAVLSVGLWVLMPVAAWAQGRPAAASSPAETDSDWRYTIQPGDTLIGLSERFLLPGRPWRELQRLNRVADPLRLPPGGVLRMPLAWLNREASVAQTVFVQGEVMLLRSGQAEQRLGAGQELRSGDRLRSAAQSSATLRFVDGSRLLIPPLSDLSLEQLLVYGRSAIPAVQLRLHEGGADSQVTPKGGRVPHYEIRTPHVNLGVRGTEFRVQLQAEKAHMAVLEGRVAADSGGHASLAVPAGMGMVADGRGRPQAAPLLAAPALPAELAVVDRLPLRLRWAAHPGARGYRAQLFAEGDFSRLLLDHRGSEPELSWDAVPPDGRYSLRLRAIDALGLEGLASDRPLQIQARPEPPFSQAPLADARLYGEQVEFRWTRNSAAQAYCLQVARDADFRELQLDQAGIADVSHSARLPHGRYHWRLASQQGEARGPFGDGQAFELRPLPASPEPAEAEVAGEQLNLRWRASAGVARYELQWARDAAFSQELQSFSSDSPGLSLPRPGPGRYFLRVRGLDEMGQAGPYGQVQEIEVPYPRWLWLLPLLLLGL
ncbi:FecR domain-containing protein [Roseateles sp.]|uniref:FecR family protein n=1 Tax=Roseateles sp. TaxID=1971397 RepID=UPI003D0FBCED